MPADQGRNEDDGAYMPFGALLLYKLRIRRYMYVYTEIRWTIIRSLPFRLATHTTPTPTQSLASIQYLIS